MFDIMNYINNFYHQTDENLRKFCFINGSVMVFHVNWNCMSMLKNGWYRNISRCDITFWFRIVCLEEDKYYSTFYWNRMLFDLDNEYQSIISNNSQGQSTLFLVGSVALSLLLLHWSRYDVDLPNSLARGRKDLRKM